MRMIQRIRFSIGTIMMFVLMASAAMALFVKIQQLADSVTASVVLPPGWHVDVPSLFLLGIVLTAIALGSWKEHTAVQVMLQVTLACFGCLTLIWIGEARYERAIRYWCQATFAATVTLPMLGRRFVKSGLPRGQRREWWKRTCEAIFFSFLTMLLITAGGLLQAVVYFAASSLPLVTAPALRRSQPCPRYCRDFRPAARPPASVCPAVGQNVPV